ncbi:MAG: hypothetical protein GYA23_07225 [Methanomicrobiales archaeon]|nr:hypothetical protein [Methanomicrobiales archaeon]
MLDTKTSCLIRGIIGVIFGFLALMAPDPVKMTFSGLFLVLIGLGMALLLFLAITSRGDESMLWFGLSAVLLVIAIVSTFLFNIAGVLLIVIITAVAAYNGFYDITLAMSHPKTKYIVIPAMVLIGVAFICALYVYFPSFREHLDISVVGALALTFGIFSIGMGYYNPESADGDEPVQKAKRTFRWDNDKKED